LTLRDREIIINFRRDSYVISFGDDYLFGDNDSYLKKTEYRLFKFPGGIVLVENDDKPVGQVEMQIKDIDNKKVGYVNLFYLIPEYRGRGYGSTLIEYAEHFFLKNNINEYQLRVSALTRELKSILSKLIQIGVSILIFLIWTLIEKKYNDIRDDIAKCETSNRKKIREISKRGTKKEA
jgi:GNAT superfamily N-acetyltransferase